VMKVPSGTSVWTHWAVLPFALDPNISGSSPIYV